ncbi:MAG TPA: urate oxidase [Vicinamibacterales bacterium]|nr:urate oxidase [Vicinamibacterales bacterium]
MEQFASGPKRSYYGKGDVIAYRLNRDGHVPPGRSPVFGASVLMLLYGDAFWPTYTTGDNTGLIATDSMKNFIQRETMNFSGYDFEEYVRFLADTFFARYPQVDGMQVSATELPYAALPSAVSSASPVAFAPAGPDRAFARIEVSRTGVVESVAGVRGFKLLRLGGSAFQGFVRDEYTTLPDLVNRPLHMWLDVEWTYAEAADALNGGRVVSAARGTVRDVFAAFESGSIQQVIYQMGARVLETIPSIAEVRLEANNRTWDTIAERGLEVSVYTDPRPPYGCLGLRLTR